MPGILMSSRARSHRWRGSFSSASRALLAVSKNPDVYPKNTTLPSTNGIVASGYYFRIHFRATNAPGLVLVFSNYVDDGAVFYLNGAEITVMYSSSVAVSLPSALVAVRVTV